jgi:hypothetical protein
MRSANGYPQTVLAGVELPDGNLVAPQEDANGRQLVSIDAAILSAHSGALTYVNEERLTMAGAHQEATIPVTTTLVRLSAEGGDLRYTGTGNASGTSAGFLPKDAVDWLELPAGAHLSIYGGVGAFANLVYWKWD